MKVSIIFLDYERHDYTDKVLAQNLTNAGQEFSMVRVDRLGVSAAINEGIIRSRGHDAVVTMANDILMPDGWLAAMVDAAGKIENTGMCGIHCVEKLPAVVEINGVKVHEAPVAYGNVLIPFKAIDAVGAFNTDYDPYGMQDSDYGMRLKALGFLNYYLPNLRSQHIGHDMGSDSDYRKMKDAGLMLCDQKWAHWNKHYHESGNFTIDFAEYP